MTRFKSGALIMLPLLFIFVAGDLIAQQEEILTGVIRGTDWDGNGKVIDAVFEVESEEENDDGKITTFVEEFSINNDSIGKELFGLDGEVVEINCKILEKEDGVVYLKVLSYTIIEPVEDDLEEEEPEDPEN